MIVAAFVIIYDSFLDTFGGDLHCNMDNAVLTPVLLGRLREQNRTISRQMEDLSRRQREFAALAENMSEGVLLLDSRYNILYGNQSAYALLGEEAEPHPQGLRQETCREEIWNAVGRALAGVPRDSYYLATKLPVWKVDGYRLLCGDLTIEATSRKANPAGFILCGAIILLCSAVLLRRRRRR